MPRYEYRCDQCNTETSEPRKVDERNTLKPCPQDDCDGMMVKQISRATSFQLRGGSWAKDGYSEVQ